MNKTVYLTQDQHYRLMRLIRPANLSIAKTRMALQQRYSVEYDEHVEYVSISQGRPPNYFGAITGADENINWLLLHL